MPQLGRVASVLTAAPPFCPCLHAAAPAHGAHAQSYPSFWELLNTTPSNSYSIKIVETLGLQATLSNPKLALTMLLPQDEVRPTIGPEGEGLGTGDSDQGESRVVACETQRGAARVVHLPVVVAACEARQQQGAASRSSPDHAPVSTYPAPPALP
jgi:hypothetical protein